MGWHFRRAVVTGGAGFLGSHLCEELIARGTSVICVDNLCTGTERNLAGLRSDPRFEFVAHDIARDAYHVDDVDLVVHLASPASPVDYSRMPLETLRAGSSGTQHALELAERNGARFLLASTSEVYGDPLRHPQSEDYWGNVDPVGPRAVYDEAKRYAEALTSAYGRHRGVATRIARVFNSFGPRMRPDDGRVVSTFVRQALRDEAITVHGDGNQTRSLCYVDDTVRGLLAVAAGDRPTPVNIGRPGEIPVRGWPSWSAASPGRARRSSTSPPPRANPVGAARTSPWRSASSAGARRSVSWRACAAPWSGSPPTRRPVSGESEQFPADPGHRAQRGRDVGVGEGVRAPPVEAHRAVQLRAAGERDDEEAEHVRFAGGAREAGPADPDLGDVGVHRAARARHLHPRTRALPELAGVDRGGA